MATAAAERTNQAEKYRLLPPLSPEDYAALKSNIAINGAKAAGCEP